MSMNDSVGTRATMSCISKRETFGVVDHALASGSDYSEPLLERVKLTVRSRFSIVAFNER